MEAKYVLGCCNDQYGHKRSSTGAACGPIRTVNMGRILIKRAHLESLRFYEREKKRIFFLNGNIYVENEHRTQ
jgi:hypothetical protein